jgi:hypothetical protein
MSDSPVVVIYGSDGGSGVEEKGTEHPLTVKGVVQNPVSIGGIGVGTWYPEPSGNFYDTPPRGDLGEATITNDGLLQVWGGVLTDCGSFKEDFAAALAASLTGTVTVTNGSTSVTGSGTLFTEEITRNSYIKLDAHAEGTWAEVLKVLSDTELELAEEYTGADGSGAASTSKWQPITGSGGSISVTSSELQIATGTTSASKTRIQRVGDYAPLRAIFRIKASQRIANQELVVGYSNDPQGTGAQESELVLSGTDNTQVKFRTRSGTGSSNLEESTITLPNSLTTASYMIFGIEARQNSHSLYLYAGDGTPPVFLKTHELHVPTPYESMFVFVGTENTGVAGSSTTFYCELCSLQNFTTVDIGTSQNPIITRGTASNVAVCSNVSAAVSSTLLLSANSLRSGGSIYNDSVATLYLKLGSGASITSFTVALGRFDFYELPFNYSGSVYGYWSAATGSARVTEVF